MMNNIALDLESVSTPRTDKHHVSDFANFLGFHFSHDCETFLLTSNLKYQQLADKYAPSDPEISKTLAQLQLSPELNLHSADRVSFVPLPPRGPSGTKQQTAEAIRDGRRASQRIAFLRGWRNGIEISNKTTTATSDSIERTSRLGTSATTVFEQDFTVPGKKSSLSCPFAKMPIIRDSSSSDEAHRRILFATSSDPMATVDSKAPMHAPSADPICAALYSETHPSPPPSATGSAAKCPIRFLDQHSPEDVAKYFESHKHEIPRSHEVCVKRYQRNEEDIRKLDAKYGNLVSMISGLGQKHQPMLQDKDDEQDNIDDARSNSRVENWAKAVSLDAVDDHEAALPSDENEDDREGRFDRPMREIRVGESPSRPWGISVPFVDQPDIEHTKEKPPALPAFLAKPTPEYISHDTAKKCPFPHGQETAHGPKHQPVEKPQGKCPFDHGHKAKAEQQSPAKAKPFKEVHSQPAFIGQPDSKNVASSGGPQMIFTGPVFIGYQVEQAMELMRQWQSGGITNERT
jgi:hypothetical protein